MSFVTKGFFTVSGSSEFPTGNTYELRKQRSALLLSKSAQCIVEANQGWILDESRNQTYSDYTEIPCIDPNDNNFYGLFLKNNISGCKMFISYISAYYSGIKNYNNNSCVEKGTSKYQNGLIISIIPESSQNEFGDPTTNTFLPTDATRFVGTTPFYNGKDAAYNPDTNIAWNYVFGVTPYCIFVYSTHVSPDTITNSEAIIYVPIYACGRVFESVNHEEITTNAKYGTILFRTSAANYESWSSILTQSIKTMTMIDIKVASMCFSSYSSYNDSSLSVSKYNGEWLLGCNGSDYRVIFLPLNLDQLLLNNTSNGINWSALGCYVHTSNINTYNITPNNVFKGVLDTNLFRAIANGVRTNMYNNQNFICLEDNSGWLFGWNKYNTLPG